LGDDTVIQAELAGANLSRPANDTFRFCYRCTYPEIGRPELVSENANIEETQLVTQDRNNYPLGPLLKLLKSAFSDLLLVSDPARR
jgi:hypothetical protein